MYEPRSPNHHAQEYLIPNTQNNPQNSSWSLEISSFFIAHKLLQPDGACGKASEAFAKDPETVRHEPGMSVSTGRGEKAAEGEEGGRRDVYIPEGYRQEANKQEERA